MSLTFPKWFFHILLMADISIIGSGLALGVDIDVGGTLTSSKLRRLCDSPNCGRRRSPDVVLTNPAVMLKAAELFCYGETDEVV